ncbi:MAG: hypothetical protein ETSY1_01680 [Candidatus Entotheonella factor]|uniref:Uncharacterized protein n=1 Tax=Entotheonella factor TaxID=1429438 RepID=W4LYI9_ENTF1|nr:MAG: hypothetical protein ETSY1_01680 [Candidatus Entotheonella factor]
MPGVKGSFTEQNVTFQYGEIDLGTNRGIRINDSAGRHSQEYKLSPNPHNDPWYNKHQTAFYNQAAHSIATLYFGGNSRLFPRYGKTINVNNIEYTLEAR